MFVMYGGPLVRPLVGHYHVPFWLRAHSRSLSASNSTNNSSKAPIMMHFHFYLENLHNKNPFIIARKIQTMFWGKSKFVGRGNPSAWSVAGCWIIAGGWIQSQHCRWYFQITNLYPPSTHGLAPHILPCYANFSVLHIDYTESEKLQQRTEYHWKV